MITFLSEDVSVKYIENIKGDIKLNAYYSASNLTLHRQLIDENKIYEFVEKNQTKLIMPDQDIINALFAKQIKSLDEKLYNYDVRYYNYYKIKNGGVCDMDYIFKHTVILHFCGKKKPWNKNYSGKFHSLYKQYEKFTFN